MIMFNFLLLQLTIIPLVFGQIWGRQRTQCIPGTSRRGVRWCPNCVTCFGHLLWELYESQILQMEQEIFFDELRLPPLTESHFVNNKSIISLVGQYSSGKTTFVELLTGKRYAGQFQSLAASTSDFYFIGSVPHNLRPCVGSTNPSEGCECLNNDTATLSDGRYFIRNIHSPFHVFQHFSGVDEVVNSMQAAFVDSSTTRFLDSAYIIDTPGILSNYRDSCDWQRFYDALYFQSDMIIFMFNPYHASDLASSRSIFLFLKRSVICKYDITCICCLDIFI